MCTEAENFKCVALTPWATQSQLLANTSNRFIGVISRLSNLPRDLLSAQLTLGPLRKPGLQFKSQEAAGLHFCWAVGKHADYCQEKKKRQTSHRTLLSERNPHERQVTKAREELVPSVHAALLGKWKVGLDSLFGWKKGSSGWAEQKINCSESTEIQAECRLPSPVHLDLSFHMDGASKFCTFL